MRIAILTVLVCLAYCNLNTLFAQCTGSGAIVTSGSGALGNPVELDPDSDGDIVAGGSVFAGCTNELVEFEQLTNPLGCNTCQVPWTAISSHDTQNDLWSGGGCGQTDIVGDDDDGETFGYFTIVDPDGICNNNDELIIFRQRIAGNFTGAFSFSFLVSNDGLVGANDPDGYVCCSKLANAGFEFEIQLKTGGSGAGVNVYDVDGLAGSDNCAGSPSNCPSYTLANNSQKAAACGSACGCRTGGGNPQFLTFFVKLSDLGVDCSNYTQLTFVPVTSTSPNPALSGCTSVSDVGGAAELDSIFVDCPDCEGVLYTGCSAAISEQGCVLACTAESNSFLTALPVELESIRGIKKEKENILKWTTSSEINVDYFSVERSAAGEDNFIEIGRVSPRGSEYEGATYEFVDTELSPLWYYRLKVIDQDRSFKYSNTIAIQRVQKEFSLIKLYTSFDNNLEVAYNCPNNSRAYTLFISDINGSVLWSSEKLSTGEEASHSISLHSLSRGLYFLSLTDGLQITTEKFTL